MSLRRLAPALALGLLLAVAPDGCADLVHLKSGKILDGQIHDTDGGIALVGPGGRVVIAHGLVAQIEVGRNLAELIADRFKAAPATADGRYLLGRWFSARGLGVAAQRAYREAITHEPDHLLSRRALGQVRQGDRWVGHRELAREAGLTRRGSWPGAGGKGVSVVPAGATAPPADHTRRLAWCDRRFAELTDEAARAKDIEARARLNLSRRAVTRGAVEVLLRNEEPARRCDAARLLGKHSEVSALASLVRSSVADRSRVVRKAAVDALNKIDDPHTALYYLKPLANEHHQIRFNAIQALGEVQGDLASEVLVKTLMAVYGGGPRVYIAITDQTAYVRDYEVEVAQDSAIADPEIGYVQSGVVLEMKVYRIMEYITVQETRLIADALQKKTGLALGPDPQKWLAWWNKKGPRKTPGS